MKESFLTAITKPPKVIVNTFFCLCVCLFLSFFVFPCSKWHLVSTYLNTIQMTLHWTINNSFFLLSTISNEKRLRFHKCWVITHYLLKSNGKGKTLKNRIGPTFGCRLIDLLFCFRKLSINVFTFKAKFFLILYSSPEFFSQCQSPTEITNRIFLANIPEAIRIRVGTHM